MKQDLKKELCEAFAAPSPTRKREFLNRIPQSKISNLAFLRVQITYIPKYVWGTFGIILGIAILGGCFLEQDILWVISALIPFIALTAITFFTEECFTGTDDDIGYGSFDLNDVINSHLHYL